MHYTSEYKCTVSIFRFYEHFGEKKEEKKLMMQHRVNFQRMSNIKVSSIKEIINFVFGKLGKFGLELEQKLHQKLFV